MKWRIWRASGGCGSLSYCNIHDSTFKETFQMQLNKIAGIFFAVTLACGTVALAQDGAKQDVKDAGHDTKKAAVATGHATKKIAKKTAHGTKVVAKDTAHGTKIAAKDTAHGTKVATEKTATGTRNVGRRAEGKEPVPNNPH
jgi:hypothetical protein